MKAIEKLARMNIPDEFFECSVEFWQEAANMTHGTVKLALQQSPSAYHFGIEKDKSYPPVDRNNKKVVNNG
jgi:hypothetical protein